MPSTLLPPPGMALSPENADSTVGKGAKSAHPLRRKQIFVEDPNTRIGREDCTRKKRSLSRNVGATACCAFSGADGSTGATRKYRQRKSLAQRTYRLRFEPNHESATHNMNTYASCAPKNDTQFFPVLTHFLLLSWHEFRDTREKIQHAVDQETSIRTCRVSEERLTL